MAPRTKPNGTPNDLVGVVVERIKAVNMTSKEIASAAGVEESWLRMFRRGKIKNPGVRQFQKLVDYLQRPAAKPKARPESERAAT